MIFNTTTHTYIFQTVYTYALTAHRHCSPCYCAYINLHIYMARSIQIYFLYFLLDSFILSWVPYSIHSLTSENFWYFYFAYFFSKTVFILHGTFVSASISAPKFSRVVRSRSSSRTWYHGPAGGYMRSETAIPSPPPQYLTTYWGGEPTLIFCSRYNITCICS